MPLFPPTAKIPLPAVESLGEFLVDLLGKGASAVKGDRFDIVRSIEREDAHYAVGVWNDDLGRPTALCVVEAALAAAMGAALILAPATGLAQIASTGVIPDNLVENYREVLNIMTTTLQQPRVPHLKFADLYSFPGDIPEDVVQVVTSHGSRKDFTVTIDGYHKGRFTLLAR